MERFKKEKLKNIEIKNRLIEIGKELSRKIGGISLALLLALPKNIEAKEIGLNFIQELKKEYNIEETTKKTPQQLLLEKIAKTQYIAEAKEITEREKAAFWLTEKINDIDCIKKFFKEKFPIFLKKNALKIEIPHGYQPWKKERDEIREQAKKEMEEEDAKKLILSIFEDIFELPKTKNFKDVKDFYIIDEVKIILWIDEYDYYGPYNKKAFEEKIFNDLKTLPKIEKKQIVDILNDKNLELLEYRFPLATIDINLKKYNSETKKCESITIRSVGVSNPTIVNLGLLKLKPLWSKEELSREAIENLFNNLENLLEQTQQPEEIAQEKFRIQPVLVMNNPNIIEKIKS
jgi:hypothetical protein